MTLILVKCHLENFFEKTFQYWTKNISFDVLSMVIHHKQFSPSKILLPTVNETKRKTTIYSNAHNKNYTLHTT